MIDMAHDAEIANQTRVKLRQIKRMVLRTITNSAEKVESMPRLSKNASH